jgi:predicted HAD superfamily Cof-like phosphohydrolase
MSNYLQSVSEFHETFKAPILESPQIPSKERCELRVSLLQEELNELKQAIEDNDLVEISHYKQKDGTEGRYEEVNGKYIVYRSVDNKVLKSVGYSPASLEDIIKG